jgi:hypothetical protein
MSDLCHDKYQSYWVVGEAHVGLSCGYPAPHTFPVVAPPFEHTIMDNQCKFTHQLAKCINVLQLTVRVTFVRML